MGSSQRIYPLVLVAVACVGLLCSTSSTSAQEAAIFRLGTRLVEVDVVVRDKNGPVKGLSKDDFGLLDCKASERNLDRPFAPCKGKRQALEMFREMDAAAPQGAAPALTKGTEPAPMSLGPGAVSNRVDNAGKALTTATVVVFDQLNTPFELKGYERTEIAKLVQTVGDKNRIALYALGKDLHILQDFTDDPQKLIHAVTKLDSGDQLNVAAIDAADPEVDPLEKLVADDMKRDAALAAIKKIIQHMAGVPGRKNLVWMAGGFDALFNPQFQRPEARILLGQANIAVYPVMVRSLQDAGIPINARYTRGRPVAPAHINDFNTQIRNRELGESLGGFGFDDAADALKAVQTAEEDANNYYVLGFYPADEDLDGGTHQLVLNISKRVAARPDLVLQYRQVYLASKPSSAIAEDTPTVEELFGSPLNATAIGLAANVVADRAKPGGRLVQVTIRLADLQLRHDKGRSIGSFQMVVKFEKSEAGVVTASPPVVQTVPINFTDAQLQEYGVLTQAVPLGQKFSAAHIVVQDGTNGAAGSLRVPIPDK